MFNRRNRSPAEHLKPEVLKYDPESTSGKFEDIILKIGVRMLSVYTFDISRPSGLEIDLTRSDEFDKSFGTDFIKAIEASTKRFTPTRIAMAGRDTRGEFDHLKLLLDGHDYELDDIALLSLNGVECSTEDGSELNLRLRLIDKYGETRDLDNIDVEAMVDNIYNIVK